MEIVGKNEKNDSHFSEEVEMKTKKENGILKDIWNNRKLIAELSKNDFKSKYAGSYFGIIWAFVQPVITILVYWFVFDKALNAASSVTKQGIEVPYVLWLIAGMVPWFYFAEVANSGTNVLIEYNYLVKKVVFNIDVLPVVKLISSLFVHVFFVLFMFVVYLLYGFHPTLYMLQVIYYSFAMFCMCLGLALFTSAITVFFRDLSQLISIFLQVLMWMTPIMWNIGAMEDKLAKPILLILKANPMYYIVSGYRDSMIDQHWFWERQGITIYFWAFTLFCILVGAKVFKKLKIHFADVL